MRFFVFGVWFIIPIADTKGQLIEIQAEYTSTSSLTFSQECNQRYDPCDLQRHMKVQAMSEHGTSLPEAKFRSLLKTEYSEGGCEGRTVSHHVVLG